MVRTLGKSCEGEGQGQVERGSGQSGTRGGKDCEHSGGRCFEPSHFDTLRGC